MMESLTDILFLHYQDRKQNIYSGYGIFFFIFKALRIAIMQTSFKEKCCDYS